MMDEREIERLRSLGLTDEAIGQEAERRLREQLGDSMPGEAGQKEEGLAWTLGGEQGGSGGLAYPVTFEIGYPEQLSRWNTFFRWFLILPFAFPYVSAFILLPLSWAMVTTAVVAWFGLLSNARYPRLLYPIAVWAQRLNLHIQAYSLLVTDQFPFDERDRPIRYEVEYPASQGRLSVFFRLILVIPHIVVLFFLGIVLLATTVIAWFGILITGNYPEGLWRFAVGVLRWGARVSAYAYLLTDQYPPFSLT